MRRRSGQACKCLFAIVTTSSAPTWIVVAQCVGIRVVRTAVPASLMNFVCERFMGSVRRECLDHMIVLDEAHLHRVLNEYALHYFNTSQPHQGIHQQITVPVERRSLAAKGVVASISVLGGLHHDYMVAA